LESGKIKIICETFADDCLTQQTNKAVISLNDGICARLELPVLPIVLVGSDDAL
jgi:hypothetical protein